jgi:hypothetical protein
VVIQADHDDCEGEAKQEIKTHTPATERKQDPRQNYKQGSKDGKTAL